MFYVVGEYWDFILLAFAIGLAIGWWSEGAPAATTASSASAAGEIKPEAGS